MLPLGSFIHTARGSGTIEKTRTAMGKNKPTTSPDRYANLLESLAKYMDVISPFRDLGSASLGLTKAILAFAPGYSDSDKQQLEEAFDGLAGQMGAKTSDCIKNDEVKWPPGHPVKGTYYKEHPLTKEIMIPLEQYDSILLAERETELIKLLVELGATQIVIEDISQKTKEASVASNLELKGAASIETNLGAQASSGSKYARTIELRGFPWTESLAQRIEECEFGWLDHEPGWRALVHSRTVGRCKRASVFLTNRASYSVQSQLTLVSGVLMSQAVPGEAKASAEFHAQALTSYRFDIEFNDEDPISPPASADEPG